MKDCIVCMTLGFIAGALVVSSNNKVQNVVEKGKKAVKEQIEKLSN